MWPVEVLSRPYYRHRPRQVALRLLRALLPAAPIQEVTLPWGLRMKIDINEMLGTSVWQTGVFDIAVSEAIWRLLRPGDLAVDVGANIGYMTGIMAARVGVAGRVLAFEPHPRIGAELERNLELFRRSGKVGEIRFFPVALSSRSGTSTMVDGAGFAENHGLARLVGEQEGDGGARVETRRLDELLPENEVVALMKLDVEGHEEEVLRGAEEVLHARRVRSIVYEDHNGPGSRVHALLADLGYRIRSLGWSTHGLVLGPVDAVVAKPFEAPSFLATLEPAETIQRLLEPGWQVLGGRLAGEAGA
ncbi:MAG TPA: FkbM family methyltransferase [Longimicrobiaceae bacterium]|nr:FkbM family methyltransferase [Longimicrobiaceae bacterium]